MYTNRIITRLQLIYSIRFFRKIIVKELRYRVPFPLQIVSQITVNKIN